MDAVELDALLLEGEACEVEPEALGALRQMRVRKQKMTEERSTAREVSDKKWKLGKGTPPTDDREHVAQGRLDTLAGLAAQAEAIRLSSAERNSLACPAEHGANDGWRGSTLSVLRQKKTPLVELQPMYAATDEQVCLEFDATKLMAARRELLAQFAVRLPETTPSTLDAPKAASATASTALTTGDVHAVIPAELQHGAACMDKLIRRGQATSRPTTR